MSEPLAVPAEAMTTEGFLDWAASQERGRYELVGGEVVAMSPQTGDHLRAKGAVYRALNDAIAAVGGLPCEALPDGASVVVDERTTFEPDAMVNCGQRMGGTAVVAPSPVVVVEVVSRGSRRVDSGIKFAGYFRVPSIMHYVILWPERRTVVHHRRGADGRIESAVLGGGTLLLDPPGFAVAIEALFPTPAPGDA